MLNQASEKTGFVAIGRNEGARLERCIDGLLRNGARIVYVDSGSQDDSIAAAEKCGVSVLALSDDKPFTAARARNEGFSRLVEQWPDTSLVMFIDGDCELVDEFVPVAIKELHENPTVGIVTGRCKERYPDASVYNRLCDIEWDGPVGEIDACGGIFITRTSTFQAANGFNSSLIAGEEPEFCIRVRAADETVVRLKNDMCFHDANMRRFGQWWRRAIRAGHSYAQVSQLHPGYYLSERRRAWFWGAVLPGVILTAAPITGGWSGVLILLYGVSFLKSRRGLIKSGVQQKFAGVYAGFLVLSKFPNLIGLLSYHRKKLFRQPVNIVEYK